MALVERGSGDGTFVTLARQNALGTKVATNSAPAPNITLIGDDLDIGANNALSAFTAFTGEGVLTIVVSAVRNNATLAIAGQDADGNAVSETLTYVTGDDATKTTTNEYARTGLMITPASWTPGDTADVSVDLADTPGFIQDRFGVSSLTLNEIGEPLESNNFRSFGSSQRRRQGPRSTTGGFNGDAEFLKLMHLFRAAMAPETVTSTAVSIQDDVLATAQALTTRLEAASTTFSSGNTASPSTPSRFRITLSGVATTGGTLTVTGKRRTGNLDIDQYQRTEEITVNTTDTVYTTAFTWSELVSIVPGGGLAGAGVTYQIDYLPDTFTTEMKFNPDFTARQYYTSGFAKGGVPYVGQDLILNRFELNASETDVAYVTDWLGNRTDVERTIAGGSARRIAFENAVLTANFAPKSDQQLSPQLNLLEIGGVTAPFSALDVVINQNYEFTSGVRGSNYRYGVTRSGDREVLFNATPIFQAPDALSDTYTPWETIDRDNSTFTMKATYLAYDGNGKEFKIELSTPSGELSESANVNVTADGPIDLPLPLKALSTATEASELVATFTGPEYTEA